MTWQELLKEVREAGEARERKTAEQETVDLAMLARERNEEMRESLKRSFTRSPKVVNANDGMPRYERLGLPPPPEPRLISLGGKKQACDGEEGGAAK